MKWVKRGLTALLWLPVAAISLFVIYELLGAGVNRAATLWQTEQARRNVIRAVEDADVIQVDSRTGNTSGTGNHVDMLTQIIFTSSKTPEEVERAVEAYYAYDEWYCYVEQTENGYQFYLNTPAPFADNIVGH